MTWRRFWEGLCQILRWVSLCAFVLILLLVFVGLISFGLRLGLPFGPVIIVAVVGIVLLFFGALIRQFFQECLVPPEGVWNEFFERRSRSLEEMLSGSVGSIAATLIVGSYFFLVACLVGIIAVLVFSGAVSFGIILGTLLLWFLMADKYESIKPKETRVAQRNPEGELEYKTVKQMPQPGGAGDFDRDAAAEAQHDAADAGGGPDMDGAHDYDGPDAGGD